jgi:hypothetical protein
LEAPSYPTPPDPAATAAAQGAANKETAIANATLNRVDQYGPQGTVKYAQTGTDSAGTPTWRQDTTLSPEYQQMFNNQTGIANKLGEFGLSQGTKVGELLSKPFDPNSAAEDKIVAMQRARLDPQFAQQEEALRTQLINSGMRPGTEAYDREIANFGQRKQDAYNSMYLSGRQQAVSEAQLQRSVPLNELMAVMSGNQVQNPNYAGVPTTAQANTDVAGIYQNNFNNQMGIANAQNATNNAMMGGMAGILGAGVQAIKWSDRRLKKDIVDLGTTSNGLTDYEWTYVWNGPRYRGYMADEVEALYPHAVGELHGFKFVRYEEI